MTWVYDEVMGERYWDGYCKRCGNPTQDLEFEGFCGDCWNEYVDAYEESEFKADKQD